MALRKEEASSKIFTLREIQVESFEYDKPTFVIFIQIINKFMTKQNENNYIILEELEVSRKVTNMIHLTQK